MALNASSLTSRIARSRTSSQELPENAGKPRFVETKATRSAASARKSAMVVTPDKAAHISRLELLLHHPKKPDVLFVPLEDSNFSQAINKKIRMSAQWTDVRDAVLHAPFLNGCNAAYALYRLGCLNAYASQKRKRDLEASGIIPSIFGVAIAKLDFMESGSLVLLLDGCGRLHFQPTLAELDIMADRVGRIVNSLDAYQLPLTLWAFTNLKYKPRKDILKALEDAVQVMATNLSPQGIALVLGGFQAAHHRPSQGFMHNLAQVLQEKLALFKPSDLAACLNALSAFNFHPPTAFTQAISERAMSDINAGVVSGKDSLNANAMRAFNQACVSPP